MSNPTSHTCPIRHPAGGEHALFPAREIRPAPRPTGSTLSEEPADAYWDVQPPCEPLENFPISKRPRSRSIPTSSSRRRLGSAAARANREVGVLTAQKQFLSTRHASECIDGEHHDGSWSAYFFWHVHQHERERGHHEPRWSMRAGYDWGRDGVLRPMEDVFWSNNIFLKSHCPEVSLAFSLKTLLGPQAGAPPAVVRPRGPGFQRDPEGQSRAAPRRGADDAQPGFHGFASTLGEGHAGAHAIAQVNSVSRPSARSDPGYAAAAECSFRGHGTQPRVELTRS